MAGGRSAAIASEFFPWSIVYKVPYESMCLQVCVCVCDVSSLGVWWALVVKLFTWHMSESPHKIILL